MPFDLKPEPFEKLIRMLDRVHSSLCEYMRNKEFVVTPDEFMDILELEIRYEKHGEFFRDFKEAMLVRFYKDKGEMN